MRDDGGPAFPNQKANHTVDWAEGMSLRDYFASKAMEALISNHMWDANANNETGVSRVAYIVADAMLKARKQ